MTAQRPTRSSRHGQSLVEFALVALALYLVMAAVIEFGRMYFGAQAVQSAVDLAAREFARMPAAPNLTIGDGLDQGAFKNVYDERFLVIDIAQAQQQSADGTVLGYVSQNFPIVNQQLFPLMHYLEVGTGGSSSQGQTQKLLAFPGMLIKDPRPETAPQGALNDGYVVRVPVVVNRSGPNGAETVVIHRVLEAVNPAADNYPLFTSAGQVANGGIAALRLNYPFQAATMSGYPWDPANPGAVHVLDANTADDSKNANANGFDVSVQDPYNLLGAEQLLTPSFSPVYEGPFSLGERQALGRTVRPFRKTISCQAVYRREIYGSGS